MSNVFFLYWQPFFTDLMQKLFILIHLLPSSTCFEHYCAHLQEDNWINTASGIVTLFGWLFSTQVTRGLSPIHVSSTIVLIFRRTIVLTQPLVSSLSLGDCSAHSTQESSRNLCTEQSPKESDDTRGCVNTIVLLKMSTIMLETCIGLSPLVTCVLKSHPKRVTIPEAVLIQLSSWRWAQ